MQKIIFMGTPNFSVPILEALIQADQVNVAAVVTQPDRKVGRKKVLTPPPVKAVAENHGLLVLQPEHISDSEELKAIMDIKPDLIVTAAFGQFLPESLLNLPKYGSINVHASLLPKYRGAAPIHYAIWNGDEETGVSLMYMTKQMDAGDIISQASLPIDPEDDTGDLFEKLSYLGRDLLMDTLPSLFNQTATAKPQEANLVSYAPMISSSQEIIDWQESASNLYNKIRAFRPYPGTYTMLDGQRFKLWDAAVSPEKTDRDPGEIVAIDKQVLKVACGQGSVLSLTEVQPAGKARMSVQSYLSGSNLEVGMSFG